MQYRLNRQLTYGDETETEKSSLISNSNVEFKLLNKTSNSNVEFKLLNKTSFSLQKQRRKNSDSLSKSTTTAKSVRFCYLNCVLTGVAIAAVSIGVTILAKYINII